ncbi:pancreatic alpha-amylase-like isoform X4 [Aquarana catesbeiana]|uniref:pancreatic alpha-amylase-like isoform X4 n=1 Tax=Aquarana catesbeiana TaxID=8400 RepID=UPI003CC9EDA0
MRLWLSFVLVGALAEICAAQFNPNVKCGRTSIVHLFEWRWEDIAVECERYLGPNGFGGIQISPPSENVIIKNPNRPWWERYQPVSYKICTRSGNEQQFRDMVTRCNNVGVYIYADAVINHMCGAGVGKGKSSTCVSPYDTITREFPAVPYSSADFNDKKCKSESGGVENYNDANQVIDLGGEGISASEYSSIGRITEFKYGAKLGKVIRKWDGEKLAYLKNWGEGWGFMPSDRALVFVDNHDNQRGHGAGGASILTFWDARLYKMATGFMLAHPYGFTQIMSSFRWPRNIVNGKDTNDWVGPPSYNNGSIMAVTINEDTTCGSGWVCEHRWRQIKNMVIFRNVVNGQALINWWDNEQNQVAFGRGSAGFIVFNNDNWDMDVTLDTGLPPGTYCDIISGQKEDNRCTGEQISVGNTGLANFKIKSLAEDPFVAIHINAKL